MVIKLLVMLSEIYNLAPRRSSIDAYHIIMCPMRDIEVLTFFSKSWKSIFIAVIMIMISQQTLLDFIFTFTF